MRTVKVTLEVTDAWEVWVVTVPDDATEEWIRDNFHETGDKTLHDSGSGVQEITTIEDY